MHLLHITELLTPADVIDGVPVVVGPAYENGNSTLNVRDAFISVSLALRCGAWVVSAFKIGADGEPDTDDGEIFVRTFQRETVARWLYLSCAKKLKPEGG